MTRVHVHRVFDCAVCSFFQFWTACRGWIAGNLGWSCGTPTVVPVCAGTPAIGISPEKVGQHRSLNLCRLHCLLLTGCLCVCPFVFIICLLVCLPVCFHNLFAGLSVCFSQSSASLSYSVSPALSAFDWLSVCLSVRFHNLCISLSICFNQSLV